MASPTSIHDQGKPDLHIWLTPIRWWLSLLTISAAVVLISAVVSTSYVGHHSLDLDETQHVAKCESTTLNSLRPQPQSVDMSVLANVYSFCYQQVAQEDILIDFGIRKSAYLNQQSQTPILMWMVVAITLSGVILAGLQLGAGYRLASLGKAAFEQGNTELTVEQSKISLSSSVTGLVILTISLAFFIVFVYKVYLIQETHTPVDAPISGAVYPATTVPPRQSTNSPQAQTGVPAAASTSPAPQPQQGPGSASVVGSSNGSTPSARSLMPQPCPTPEHPAPIKAPSPH